MKWSYSLTGLVLHVPRDLTISLSHIAKEICEGLFNCLGSHKPPISD